MNNTHKFKTLFAFAITIFFLSCQKESTSILPNTEGTNLTTFSFLKVNNPTLITDIVLVKEANTFSGRALYGTNIKSLVPTFQHNGLKVTRSNIDQISSVTSNDFTDILIYTVKTSDGRSTDYTINLTYFTGLPIVHIDTYGVPIVSKDDEIPGLVAVEGIRNFNSLDPSSMMIRGRGNSTWFIHPKKPYQMKFSSATQMLGMPADKKWIFLAEYSDKTMIRNKIAFEMGYLSSLAWTPKAEYAEVFLNNIYNGTYNITQKVEKGTNRVNLGSTGFLLEIDQLDRLDPGDVYFYTGNFLVNIKEPNLTNGSPEYNYIKNLINEFEAVLFGSQFTDPVLGYAKYIDIDSFVDWYLISEITKNQDSKSFSSIYFNVIPGEKINMGPLWDFDLAFGNVNYSEATSSIGFWVKDHKWFQRLFQDPSFVLKVKSRFNYYKNNQDYIIEKINLHAKNLKLAQVENNNKWHTIGVYVWPNPVVYNTYDEEVNHLKNWYINRMNWLSNAYNNL